MSLFEVTPDIQKLAEPVAEGWHPAKVHKIQSRLSNSGSKMVLFTFKITGKQLDGDNDNKNSFAFYNVNNDYLQYSLDFLSTVTDTKFDKNKTSKLFETDDAANKALKDKPFEVYVEPREYEGKVSNNVTKIRKAGSVKAA